MSVSAIGGAPVSAATYDFTNVTNGQFLQEVQSLGKQGALSPNQQVLLTLAAEGGDSIPVNGQPLSTTQALSDPTTRNFILDFQVQDSWINHTPGTVGGALVDSVLRTLQAYQGAPIPGSSHAAPTEAPFATASREA